MNLVLGRLKSKYEYHITTQHVTLFLFSITGKTFTIICDWNKSVLWLSSPQSWRTVNTASDNCHRKTEPDLKTTDVYPDLRNPPYPTRLLVIFLLQHVVMYKCNTILMVFFFLLYLTDVLINSYFSIIITHDPNFRNLKIIYKSIYLCCMHAAVSFSFNSCVWNLRLEICNSNLCMTNRCHLTFWKFI